MIIWVNLAVSSLFYCSKQNAVWSEIFSQNVQTNWRHLLSMPVAPMKLTICVNNTILINFFSLTTNHFWRAMHQLEISFPKKTVDPNNPDIVEIFLNLSAALFVWAILCPTRRRSCVQTVTATKSRWYWIRIVDDIVSSFCSNIAHFFTEIGDIMTGSRTTQFLLNFS